MLLQKLENAAGILQREIFLSNTFRVFFYRPGRFVIFSGAGIIPGEKTVIEVELIIDQKRRIRVVDDIFLKIFFVFDNILDHPAEESNVGART